MNTEFDIIEKRETCLYCGKPMKSETAKRKFCCDKHRVYYNRAKFPEKYKTKEPVIEEQKIVIEAPPEPVKEKILSSVDHKKAMEGMTSLQKIAYKKKYKL